MKKTNKTKKKKKVGSEEVLEFEIGLGWLGWERQNYLWTAGAAANAAGTAPVTPTAAGGLGKGAAAAGRAGSAPELPLHASRLPTLGEMSCKKTFSARGSGSLASSWPGSIWDFPAEGLDAAP